MANDEKIYAELRNGAIFERKLFDCAREIGMRQLTDIGLFEVTPNTDPEHPGLSITYTPQGDTTPIEIAYFETDGEKVKICTYKDPLDPYCDDLSVTEFSHEDALAAVQSIP